MKYDKEYIEQLLQRFMQGQTSEQEEQLLSDYFSTSNTIPEEWEQYRVLFDSFSTDAYDFSKEELDTMLITADDRKAKLVRLLPWASVACVAAIVGLFLWHPWGENPVSETHSIAQLNSEEKVTKIDTVELKNNEVIEEKTLIAEEHVKETSVAIQNTSKHLAKAKQSASPKEITTSELLETINLLVDVGNENITITSLPDNEGYAVRTVSYEGESNSYLLKRCAESSSLELKSQVINF